MWSKSEGPEAGTNLLCSVLGKTGELQMQGEDEEKRSERKAGPEPLYRQRKIMGEFKQERDMAGYCVQNGFKEAEWKQ